jgi:hypothetical protein
MEIVFGALSKKRCSSQSRASIRQASRQSYKGPEFMLPWALHEAHRREVPATRADRKQTCLNHLNKKRGRQKEGMHLANLSFISSAVLSLVNLDPDEQPPPSCQLCTIGPHCPGCKGSQPAAQEAVSRACCELLCVPERSSPSLRKDQYHGYPNEKENVMQDLQ